MCFMRAPELGSIFDGFAGQNDQQTLISFFVRHMFLLYDEIMFSIQSIVTPSPEFTVYAAHLTAPNGRVRSIID